MIKYKILISVRILLNFIYDILVESSIDSINSNIVNRLNKIILTNNKRELLPLFIENLIFDNIKSNKVLDGLKNIDPLISREKEKDLNIINLGLDLKNISSEGDSFFNWLLKDNFSNQEEKIEYIKYHLRYDYFQKDSLDKTYQEYLKDLFNLNAKSDSRNVYKKVLKAIYEWNGGSFDKKQFVIHPGRKQMKYKLSKELDIIPIIEKGLSNSDTLNKFNQDLILKYRFKENKVVEFQIDYFLYEIFTKMEKGYIPSILDKNNYIQFESALSLISNNGDGNEDLHVVDRLKKYSFKITNDMFGSGWCIKWN